MHQLLTGHDPAKQPFRFPASQLLNPAISLPLADLIGQMLEMDEKNRPSSALVVKLHLEQLLNLSLPTQTDSVDTQDHHAVVSSTKPTLRSPQSAKKNLVTKKIQGGGQRSKGALGPRLAWMFFWVCFIVLVASLGIGLSTNLDNSFGGCVAIAGITGALFGLDCFLTRGRLYMNSIGGVVFTICGNIAFFCFKSSALYECSTQRDKYGVCSGIMYNMYDPNKLVLSSHSLSWAHYCCF